LITPLQLGPFRKNKRRCGLKDAEEYSVTFDGKSLQVEGGWSPKVQDEGLRKRSISAAPWQVKGGKGGKKKPKKKAPKRKPAKKRTKK
jgi:hypothetical protein